MKSYNIYTSLLLDRNNHYLITVCKFFVLKIAAWTSKFFLSIILIIIYLETDNKVQNIWLIDENNYMKPYDYVGLMGSLFVNRPGNGSTIAGPVMPKT